MNLPEFLTTHEVPIRLGFFFVIVAADELKQRLESRYDLLLLDVRTAADFVGELGAPDCPPKPVAGGAGVLC